MITSEMKTGTAMLDRVEVTIYDFDIFPVSRSEYLSLREAIGITLFRTAKHFPGNSTYKSMSLPHVSGTGRLSYLPEKQSCTLTLKIKLNPTRLLLYNLLSEDRIRNRQSLDGNDNYIPRHIQWLLGESRLQKQSIDLLADKIQTIIIEFAYCIEANVMSYSRLDPPRVSWALTEIYWDLYNQSPYSYISSCKPKWMSHFMNPKCPQFLCPLPSEELRKSAQYLTCKSRAKEQLKLYSKTPDLVRYEVEFRSTRIRSICGTTVLKSPTSESIYSFVEPLASHAINEFKAINLPVCRTPDNLITFTPLYRLARACGRDYHLFELILNELKYNRRLVSRPEYYVVIPRLQRTKDWERIGRGIYRPSAHLLSLIDRLYR